MAKPSGTLCCDPAAKRDFHMVKRRLIPLLILGSFAASASPAAAAPQLAIEPSDPRFRDGLATLPAIPKGASAAAEGGTSPGDTPASVGLDLMLGPAVTDTLLAWQLKAAKPLSTDALRARIPIATAASTNLKDLRGHVIRIANAYLKGPTLEDRNSPNRSKLICAMGTKESCEKRWPWCAIFATSIWRMAGIKAIPMLPPVSGIVAWGKNRQRWSEAYTRTKVGTKTTTTRFMPAAGDIVAFGCNRSRNWCEHTGIVARVSGNVIYTIEGNTSTGIPGRDGVAAKARAYDSWISGFITLS